MGNLLINSVFCLSGIGVVAAGILFIASKKFKVFEDPKIDEIEQVLPAANCGGCGFAGCRNFAEAVVKAGDLSSLHCPVGGSNCMEQVAAILGLQVEQTEPLIAVLRCNGSRHNAVAKVKYDGIANCSSAHNLFSGESGCAYGCLGLGDCVDVCQFEAITLNMDTGLPEVDEEKCVACGACIRICPRNIYELRPKGKDDKRVFVACMNKEKGAVARKNCNVACIGCGKCAKVTDSKEVKIENFLSYIGADFDVVAHGTAVVDCCPTKAIIGVNI